MRFWYSLREKHEKTKVDVSRFLPIRTDENGITKHKKRYQQINEDTTN